MRIFEDSDFEDVGAVLVEEGSWPDAPEDHLIIGLKEVLDPHRVGFPHADHL